MPILRLAFSIPVVFVIAVVLSWSALEPWPKRLCRALCVAAGPSLVLDVLAATDFHEGPLLAVTDLLVLAAGVWGLKSRASWAGTVAPLFALVLYLACWVEFTYVTPTFERTCSWRVEYQRFGALTSRTAVRLTHPDGHNYDIIYPAAPLLARLQASGSASTTVRFEAMYHWGRSAGHSVETISGQSDFEQGGAGVNGAGGQYVPFPEFYFGLRHWAP